MRITTTPLRRVSKSCGGISVLVTISDFRRRLMKRAGIFLVFLAVLAFTFISCGDGSDTATDPEITDLTFAPNAGLTAGLPVDTELGTFGVTGGTAEFTYSLVEGTSGVSEDNALFAIAGDKLTVAFTSNKRSYHINVKVEDSKGKSLTKPFEFDVGLTFTFNEEPGLQVGLPTVEAGAEVGWFAHNGATAPYTFALAAGSGGNDADNSKFVISETVLKVGSTALTAGTYKIYVTITDAANETVGKALEIVVVPDPYTVTTANVPKTTLYLDKILVTAPTYDIGTIDGKTGVLRAQNGPGNALRFTIVPDFTGTLNLRFSADIRRTVPGTFVWQIFGSWALIAGQYGVAVGNEWTHTAMLYTAFEVTAGVPLTLQLSDGGNDGDFLFYVADFTFEAAIAESTDTAVENFEGSTAVTAFGNDVYGTAVVETLALTNNTTKGLVITSGGYQSGASFPITIPAGKSLADYTSIVVDAAALSGGDITSKKVRFWVGKNELVKIDQDGTDNGADDINSSQVSSKPIVLPIERFTTSGKSELTTTDLQTLTGTILLGVGLPTNAGSATTPAYKFVVDNVLLRSTTYTPKVVAFQPAPPPGE
jgi:hypothetical protein